MADLTITANNVKKVSGNVVTKNALEVIAAGKNVYVAADGRVGLCDNNAGDVLNAVYGIALNAAQIDQPVTVQKDGDIIIGATVAVGVVYVASATAGGIAPAADLASGNKLAIIGYGKSSTVITLDIKNTGITVA